MNYKRWMKSAKLRQKLLCMLHIVPDKTMISLQYKIKTGRKLDLKNPKRYTEKLQWYKLNYKEPTFIKCVDKYEVRLYLEEKGFGELLNKCYGIYDKFEDINFDLLPNQFVIKDTLGSGGFDIIICTDKKSFDKVAAKKKCKEWLSRKLVRSGGREWPYYSGKPHRLLVEKYMVDRTGNLTDYKFFCFDGKMRFAYYRSTFIKNHHFIDENKQTIPVKMDYGIEAQEALELPKSYDQMVELSEKLSKDFPHVRVDLYDVDGKIVFGELTFYHTSGYSMFEPDEYDYLFGDYFKLPNKIIE